MDVFLVVRGINDKQNNESDNREKKKQINRLINYVNNCLLQP